ncbi:DUF2470 domain-containing protein [Streptomyces sp. NBC_00872]|uniref:DUF2470 domain-containing protein n=1 Tax=Streptomyces sp. NBC_00872 TaxID=2903686 RepID=UPI0038697F43|nr:DUF2470 domain-containing protein [Streptomyces sp. NBC_00872]
MALADVRAAGPTDAERIRSVMTRSDSLSLTTDGNGYDLISMHTVDSGGTLRLRVPSESLLADEAVLAPRGALTSLIEFTDLAPVPVRDRVRSRVTLAGRLTPAEIQDAPKVLVLRLDMARAAIERDGRTASVGLDELTIARPDPLAIEEAALLTHLDRDHGDVVARLSRLVDRNVLQGVVHLRPLALDRYGLVLRCEYARQHQDVRLTFSSPARNADDIGVRVAQLLSRLRDNSHRCRFEHS